MRTITLSLVLAILFGMVVLAPLPCHAQAQSASQASPTTAHESSPDVPTLLEYAQREAAAPGLADFEGGGAGLLLAIVLIAAVVILIAILIPW
jgi:hypothetical protein